MDRDSEEPGTSSGVLRPVQADTGSRMWSVLAGVRIPGHEGVSAGLAGGKMAQSMVVLAEQLTESNYST